MKEIHIGNYHWAGGRSTFSFVFVGVKSVFHIFGMSQLDRKFQQNGLLNFLILSQLIFSLKCTCIGTEFDSFEDFRQRIIAEQNISYCMMMRCIWVIFWTLVIVILFFPRVYIKVLYFQKYYTNIVYRYFYCVSITMVIKLHSKAGNANKK